MATDPTGHSPDLFSAAPAEDELAHLRRIEALARVMLEPGYSFAESSNARTQLRLVLGLCGEKEAQELTAFMDRGGRA